MFYIYIYIYIIKASVCVCVCLPPDRLAEDDVAAVLQRQVHGDGGRAVLHQQEHHGLLGLVGHHGDALGERGEQRVQRLAPLACKTRTRAHPPHRGEAFA